MMGWLCLYSAAVPPSRSKWARLTAKKDRGGKAAAAHVQPAVTTKAVKRKVSAALYMVKDYPISLRYGLVNDAYYVFYLRRLFVM